MMESLQKSWEKMLWWEESKPRTSLKARTSHHPTCLLKICLQTIWINRDQWIKTCRQITCHLTTCRPITCRLTTYHLVTDLQECLQVVECPQAVECHQECVLQVQVECRPAECLPALRVQDLLVHLQAATQATYLAILFKSDQIIKLCKYILS